MHQIDPRRGDSLMCIPNFYFFFTISLAPTLHHSTHPPGPRRFNLTL